ncbi:hypothetical protein ACR82Z_04105 [Mycoplasma sp. 6243]|uniref:hypothetical protein n=1 Tax=Mycoplasma sp. 6243 TaxID=3440865 RepID=UPI003EC00892
MSRKLTLFKMNLSTLVLSSVTMLLAIYVLNVFYLKIMYNLVMSTKDEKLKQLKLIINSWIKSFTDLPNDVKEVLASYITSWNNSKDITIEKPKYCHRCGSVKIHKHGSTNNIASLWDV